MSGDLILMKCSLALGGNEGRRQGNGRRVGGVKDWGCIHPFRGKARLNVSESEESL